MNKKTNPPVDVLSLLTEIKYIQKEHFKRTKQVVLSLPGFVKELDRQNQKIISLQEELKGLYKLISKAS